MCLPQKWRFERKRVKSCAAWLSELVYMSKILHLEWTYIKMSLGLTLVYFQEDAKLIETTPWKKSAIKFL